MTFVAFANFGQKLLCKEKMIPEVQNYYLGLFNALPAFFLMLIERKTGISNIRVPSFKNRKKLKLNLKKVFFRLKL